jgi:hypothetical protein
MKRHLASLFCCLAATLAVQNLPAQAQSIPAIRRVLLISVDGLHGIDLANYIQSNPESTLAQLSKKGVVFSNATSAKPSDSFPGLLAIVTGGSPVSTGVYYDDSYDRGLSAPGSTCTSLGTEVVYDESIDINVNNIDGGGGINTAALPRNPSLDCSPVFPHSFLKVNTIFEVIKAAGKRTAWADKHPAYDLVNGPSGNGVDDLYTPEVAAIYQADGTTPFCIAPLPSSITNSVACTETYDDLKVQAIINQIDGKDHTGTNTVGVPSIFGMNFQAVSVGQKLLSSPTTSGTALPGGYLNSGGTPGPALLDALNHTDQSLGRMVSELKARGLYASTLIIVSAKHGQSPIDLSKKLAIPSSTLKNLVPSNLLAQATTDDVGLLWLTDANQTASVVQSLAANQTTAGIQKIYSGESLKQFFNDPTTDSRTPDIIVQVNQGVIYTSGSKIAEHGGFGVDDTNVALLVSNPFLLPATIKSPVETAQIAPTILQSLGLKPSSLQAVQIEKTQPLPAIQSKFH